MRASYDVCAVGGGPDALVAAAFLSLSGRSVLVVGERGQAAGERGQFGGIAANAQIAPGFEFPAAPETLPSFDPSISDHLRLADHGLEFLAPDPVLTACGRDRREPFALRRDPEAARLAIAGVSALDAARFPKFLAELRAFAGFLRRLLERPPLQLDSSLPEALPAALAAFGLGSRRLNDLLRALPMAVRDLLDDHFETEELKAALAGPALTGTRLGPRAPGTAALFLHFHGFGHPDPLGWIRPPRGGATSVGRALREAARAAGAHFEAASGGVRRLTVSLGGNGGRVGGIELADGRTIRCGAVLSDASPQTTFFRWTGAPQLPPDFLHEARNIRYRGTAARVGLALSGLPRFFDRTAGAPEADPRLGGVIQIGAALDDLERAADAAKYGEVAREPLVFAFLPSVHAPELAPRGSEVLAATVQTVPHAGPPDEEQVLEATLAALESAFPAIRELVTASRVLGPAALGRGFGLAEGSFHQGEPTLDQSYALRPVPGFAAHRTPVAGLYLAGPATYACGGLHGVSGRNAARVVEQDTDR